MNGKTPMRWKIFQLVMMLVIVAVGAFVTRSLIMSKEAPKKRPPVVIAPLVTTIEVSPADLNVIVSAYGTARPSRRVEIIPQVPGVVVGLSPKLVAGGFVDEGELLISLEPRDYELAVEKAQAEVAKTEYELARAGEEARLAKREWEIMNAAKNAKVPDDESLIFHGPQLKLAKASVSAAEARLSEARLALSRTKIIAPFNARVDTESVEIGQYLNTGRGVVTLLSTDEVEVVFPVPDDEMGWLGSFALGRGSDTAGLGVDVYISYAGREELRRGRVVRTEATVDVKSRMINVIAVVKDPYAAGKAPIVSGTFVRGEIKGRKIEGVYAIPRNILAGGSTVWVVVDGKLEKRELNVARLTSRTAYVSEGLSAGDKVVVSRLDVGVEGMKVRLKMASEAGAGK